MSGDGAPAASAEAIRQLTELARRYQLTELERRCLATTEQVGSGTVNVALLGRFKAGKTSVLNQLLGAEVLPVQAIPATAVITRARFGPVLAARVVPTRGPGFDVDPGTLAEWVTESGNPGNRRGVERVDVESPALRDIPSVVLVDTPGTGSSWEHNTDTSLDWLPNVGAAVVAVNATQPLAEEDLRLIELLQPHTPNLTILLTKVDLLAADDLTAVTRHVRQRLDDRLPTRVAVLPYSTAADYTSQRGSFRSLLQDIERAHTDTLADLATHRVRRLASECAAYLELARAAATSQEQAVDDLRRVLDEEAGRLPELRSQLRAQVRPLKNVISARAQQTMAAQRPQVIRRVAVALDVELPTWHGSLATETRGFRGWLADSLVKEFTPTAQAAATSLEPLVAQGLQSATRTGEAFIQRLGLLVHRALGIDLELVAPEAGYAPIPPVDAVVDRVFDSQLDLLSWAVPMFLARPLVHRHFRRLVPWQVEKNSYRTAHRAAAVATASLDAGLDEYLAALADQLETCRRLVAGTDTDLGALRRDLRVLDGLLRETPQPPVLAAVQTA
jgi:GTP-binding protein EngB required for normal cell division